MSVVPSRSFRDEDFRRLPARFDELRDVPLFERHHEAGVRGTAQLADRCGIDARVRVDVELQVRREPDCMVRVGRGQRRQPGPVEVDPVVVHEVRVLARIHPARAEPDLPLVLVDLQDLAHDPVALRDLVLHGPGDAVVQIEVVPAVALGHPDELHAVGEVAPEFLAGVAEEGLRLLGHDRARAPRDRVDLDDTVDLVAALVVLERDGRADLAPLQARHVVRVREQRRVDDDLLLRGDVEDDRPLDVHHVPRLRVLHRRVLRLELVLRRGFDEADVAAEAGRHLVDGNLRRVGRPHQRVGIVVAAF